ncbi:hypothetical protein DFJ74DRAFT_710009 [Hyaloraphidium curvatum]|nr:hypothetical protein DFJ74DRAFT_710009 [Hyaloraphidium curvatum]
MAAPNPADPEVRKHGAAISEVVPKLRAMGCDDIRAFRIEPPFSAADHSHLFEAFGFVVAGTWTVEKKDAPDGGWSRGVVQPGQSYHVPSMTLHRETAGPEGVVLCSGKRWPEGVLENMAKGVLPAQMPLLFGKTVDSRL